MLSLPLKRLVTCTALCFYALMSACSNAKQVDVHDPVMIKEGNQYHLFSTGMGITQYQSDNMVDWKRVGPVLGKTPEWVDATIKNFPGHMWAPDISEKDGKFYLYYSVSAFGKNTSAIGLAITETLDPASPKFKWVDQGLVIQSVPNRDAWNAIDPNVIVDEAGTPWMAFGSFWHGLKLFKLNSERTAPAEPQVWYTIAKGDRPAFEPDAWAGPVDMEAPFIFKKEKYYYLFVSLGKCCKGKDSTYHLAIGRSEKATGPYLDKNGVDMAKGGGTILIKGNKRWPGLGHNSAYTFDGKDYLVLHAYEAEDNGLQKLKIMNIKWDKDFWPVLDVNELETYRSTLIK